MSKRGNKAHHTHYTKPPGVPWMSKDDVAKQLKQLHRSFEIADNETGSPSVPWALDEPTLPQLPNWGVLLHDELYGPREVQREHIRRKYFGFYPKGSAAATTPAAMGGDPPSPSIRHGGAASPTVESPGVCASPALPETRDTPSIAECTQ